MQLNVFLPCTTLTSVRAVSAKSNRPCWLLLAARKHHRESKEATGSSQLPRGISVSFQTNSAPDWGAASIPGAVLNKINSLCTTPGCFNNLLIAPAVAAWCICSTEPLTNPLKKGPAAAWQGWVTAAGTCWHIWILSCTTSVPSFVCSSSAPEKAFWEVYTFYTEQVHKNWERRPWLAHPWDRGEVVSHVTSAELWTALQQPQQPQHD